MSMNEQLVLDLHEIGAIQFGEFRLKSGIVSPIYLDLRLLVSHPHVLHNVALALAQVLETLTFDRVAAIPYAGLPIGVAVALAMDRPLIYPRREAKDHGIARPIEGAFRKGEVAVVVDDVITTGASKIETIQPLVTAGLVVHDIVVLIDREQGGTAELAERGYHIHAVMTMKEALDILNKAGRISDRQLQDVLASLGTPA
jgi:orotate phosphoribosyltransferase